MTDPPLSEDSAGAPMLWGGRFGAPPHPDLMRLSRSLHTDIRLLPYDLRVTKAHAGALTRAGLLDPAQRSAIEAACDEILADTSSEATAVLPEDEDVHSLVERLLTEKLGDSGTRIHAGRSRNDLVATDLRLWAVDAASELTAKTARLVLIIAEVAGPHTDTLMPGYTHLQRAQPVSLAFHLAAHGYALLRDAARFDRAGAAAGVSTLGAGALAGTTLPLDVEATAGTLGFERVFDNAMDAVSDRDFALDLAYAAAVCGVHLSRLAEEIVFWTSSEARFAALADEWSTGSSMMPQKRNPDMAELIRGRAAAGIGDLTTLLSLLKGLPLAYDRDLQEDKVALFACVDRIAGCLDGMSGLLASLSWDTERLEAAARESASWATDLAELLVGRGVPFREAHGAIGGLVAALEGDGRGLAELSEEELKTFHPALEEGDVSAADARRGLRAREGRGGPAPGRVTEQLAKLEAWARATLEAS